MDTKLGFYCNKCGNPLGIEIGKADERATLPYKVPGEIMVRVKPCEVCSKSTELRSIRAFKAFANAFGACKDEDAFIEMVKNFNPDANIK
jgi:hypothetical protein